ncbi:VQ motif-containing protein [Corchorus capsularis]|uniref:VQ motif-containing protein n=1 Tax=Corchorus capsularis TaxID=210143 RepID=A0A1R3KVA9_COCAP|nr:VQ motif-containing protein [Corchorus capsularis]
MGKKVITHPASAKANNKNHHHEKQLHSLIKVLKPKVYITDSSSFKQLVQELTGFQTTTQLTSCHKYPKPEQVRQSKIPVIELDDQLEGDQIMPPAPAAAATILSTDSSLISSLKLCDNYTFDDVQAFHQLEEINQIPTTHEMMSRFEDDHHDYYPLTSTNYQQRNWLEYQNLESWLLDAAADQPFPYNCYNNGFSSTQNNIEQDHQLISVFDYELSGLI